MTKDEALRLALEALEYPGPSWIEARQPAITAIKAALEAKDEPVIDESAAKRIATALGWEPKRTWNELTLAEAKEAYNQHAKYQIEDMGVSGWVDFARAIEAKLKEKNT